MARIFAEDGEEAFREVESTVLNEVASYGRCVVSTGGGVVTRTSNWGHLRNGIVIYLDAPVECVAVARASPCHGELTQHALTLQGARCKGGC